MKSIKRRTLYILLGVGIAAVAVGMTLFFLLIRHEVDYKMEKAGPCYSCH